MQIRAILTLNVEQYRIDFYKQQFLFVMVQTTKQHLQITSTELNCTLKSAFALYTVPLCSNASSDLNRGNVASF